MKFLSLFSGGNSGTGGTGPQNQGVGLFPPIHGEVGTVGTPPAKQSGLCSHCSHLPKKGGNSKSSLNSGVSHCSHRSHQENIAGEAKCQIEEVAAAPVALAENVLPESASKAQLHGGKLFLTYWHTQGMPPAAKQAVAYWRATCPHYWRGCFTCPDATLSKLDFCRRHPMPEVAK